MVIVEPSHLDQLLDKSGMSKTSVCAYKQPTNGQTDHDDDRDALMLKGMNLKGKRFEGENMLLELEPAAAQVLHDLVSFVHNNVSIADQEQHLLSTSINNSELGAAKLPKDIRGSCTACTFTCGSGSSYLNRFYEAFYSAFDDQSMAMNSILKGKESFAQQAFKNVLEKLVGVNLESSRGQMRCLVG